MTSEPTPDPISGSELSSSDTALLETLILQAPVAFAFYGPDLRYRRINRMLADINGLPMEDHIGRRPAELLGELGVAVEQRLRQVLDTGAVVTDDAISVATPVTGELRHYQSQWFPARDSEGAVLGVAVLVSDVTDRRRADEALRRSVERTEQLQQATAALGEALTHRRRTPGGGRDRTRRHRRPDRRAHPGRRAARPRHRRPGPGAGRPRGVRRADRLAAAGVRRPGGRPGRRLPRGAGRPVRDRAGAGPPVRAGAGHRGDPAAQPAAGPAAGHARASSWPPGSVPARPRPRSAATGTTCSGCRTAGWCWWSATSWARGCAPPRGWAGCASALRALAHANPLPEAVLSGLDKVFSATEDADEIATLVYLLVNPVARRAAVGGAGHLPLVAAAGRAGTRAGGRRVRVRRRWAGRSRGPSAPWSSVPATCCWASPTAWSSGAAATWTRAWPCCSRRWVARRSRWTRWSSGSTETLLPDTPGRDDATVLAVRFSV